MGCCFSREDDRFDGSESLLPKSKLTEKSAREDFDHIDVAKKVANNGAHSGGYKSPEPSLTVQHAHIHSQQPHNHSHGGQQQQNRHASPSPPPKATVVESVDLLGLNKPESPATNLSAEVPSFLPHAAAAVANAKLPVTTVAPAKSASPQKPASPKAKPASAVPAASPPKVVEAPKPVEVAVARVATPSIEKPASLPKSLERKLSAKAVVASTAATTSASADDNDDNNDNEDTDKAPSTASSSASKKSKKKKKKGKK